MSGCLSLGQSQETVRAEEENVGLVHMGGIWSHEESEDGEEKGEKSGSGAR